MARFINFPVDSFLEDITVGLTDNPWDEYPLEASSVVPERWEPPHHLEDNSTWATSYTRTFNCSQSSQVPETPPFKSPKLKLLALIMDL